MLTNSLAIEHGLPAFGVFDFTRLGALTFEAPDHARYPGLQLAWDTLRGPAGSTAVLNAANEEAVAAFLAGTIRFDQIHTTNARTLESVRIEAGDADGIDALIALDQRSRHQARREMATKLLDLARERLPEKMGSKYSRVVETCLTCLDEGNEDFGDESEFQDGDGILVAVRYIEKVRYSCVCLKK